MALPLLAGPAYLDDATVVSTAAYRTEIEGFEADKLLDVRPHAVWRASASDARAMADLGAAREVGVAVLVGTNASATGAWRLRAGSTEANAAAGASYDSLSLGVWPVSGLQERLRVNGIHVLAAPVSARYWYVTAADPANEASYLEVAALLLAKAWRPPKNLTVEDGFRFGYLDPAEVQRSYGGALYAESRARPRFAEWTFAFLEDADKQAAADFARRYGASRPVFFSRDPEHATDLYEHAIWGHLAPAEPVFHRHQRFWSQRFRIEESL